MFKNKFLPSLIILFLFFALSGCAPVTLSPSNEIAPMMKGEIPKDNKILVMSALSNDVLLVNTSGFKWHKNVYTIADIGINSQVSNTIKKTLNEQGYKNIVIKKLPANNPLNQQAIQTTDSEFTSTLMYSGSSRGELTKNTQNYLSNILGKNKSIDDIVFVTAEGQAHVVKADKETTNLISGYIIYIVDAHNFNILTWMYDEIDDLTPGNPVLLSNDPQQIKPALVTLLKLANKKLQPMVANTMKTMVTNVSTRW